jgi:hypothetical protein
MARGTVKAMQTSREDNGHAAGPTDCGQSDPPIVLSAPNHVVLHDRNGTWFVAGDLWLSLLTQDQMHELECGVEQPLGERAALNLLDILTSALGDQELEWN